ncbi:response regulator [Cellulosilyticum sp. I15G10I2]|uniref:response regulator n=1 Tax=Cellulosilyticum sp. I15G10I2 TaxID=1892843 RepID=UPI00085CC53A|nr:response regulator [Cellulosilyticum sp. I15G10I2]
MFKVLIADDEPKIRKGIRGILDWQSIGFEIVAEAEDGEVALEKAIETAPDLLLVDICMPFVNGLEFINQLKSILNDAIIIIVSGHDEFEYAQAALKLKVFDYILKPVSQDALLKSVLKAREQMIDLKNKGIEDAFKMKQLKKSNHYLKEIFLQDLIGAKVKDENLMRQFEYFNIGYTATMGMLVIRLMDKSHGMIEREWDNDLLIYAIQNIAAEAMNGFKALTCFKDTKNQIIVISDTSPIAKWSEMGIEVEKCIAEYLRREVITEMILLKQKPASIHHAYEEISRSLTEKSQKTPIVITIQKYIDKHYANPELTLTEIAEKVGISQTYLTRLLKQELGVPFIDYLTQIRMKKALILMQDPNIKVYEVAEKTGYSSQHYFSNVFKKTFHLSPLDYKRRGVK